MRPEFQTAVGISCGAAAALVIILVVWSKPLVIAPDGAIERVPALQNDTLLNGGPGPCQQHHNCLVPGLLEVNFSTTGNTALTGALSSNVPIELYLASGADIGHVGCSLLAFPPANCTYAPGAGYGFLSESGATSLNLADLELNFSGANNEVPAGSWTIFLINWSPSPETIVVTQAITATPEW